MSIAICALWLDLCEWIEGVRTRGWIVAVVRRRVNMVVDVFWLADVAVLVDIGARSVCVAVGTEVEGSGVGRMSWCVLVVSIAIVSALHLGWTEVCTCVLRTEMRDVLRLGHGCSSI